MSLPRVKNLCDKDPDCDKNYSNKDKINYIKSNWSPYSALHPDTNKTATYWKKNIDEDFSFWESELLENLNVIKVDDYKKEEDVNLDDDYKKKEEEEDEKQAKSYIDSIEIKHDESRKPKKYRIKKYAGQWFIAIIVLFLILLITNIALTVSRNSQCSKVKNRDDPYYVAEEKNNSNASNLESFSRLQSQKSKISQSKTDDQTFNSVNDKYQNASSAYDNKLTEKQGVESLIVTDRKIESDKKVILEKLITDASKGKKASDLAIEYKKKYDDLVIQCNNIQVKINQAMLDLAAKNKLVDLTKCILAN